MPSLCLSYVFPLISLHVSFGFSLRFLCFARALPLVFPCVSYECLVFSCVCCIFLFVNSYVVLKLFSCFPIRFLCCSFCLCFAFPLPFLFLLLFIQCVSCCFRMFLFLFLCFSNVVATLSVPFLCLSYALLCFPLLSLFCLNAFPMLGLCNSSAFLYISYAFPLFVCRCAYVFPTFSNVFCYAFVSYAFPLLFVCFFYASPLPFPLFL